MIYNIYINRKGVVQMIRENFVLPEIKLSANQKLILRVLNNDFRGKAFGPQLLDESDNKDIQALSINQITWNMLRLRENGLVESEKKVYQGRILNEYKVTPIVALDAIIIK